MGSAERRKVNVLEMKCLRSLVGVSRMDRVRNEEVRRRAGIEREFASRADQRVLRWFGHVERMDEHRIAKRVLMAELSEGRVRGGLGPPREGGLGQQRNDGWRLRINELKIGKSEEPWYVCHWMSSEWPFLLGPLLSDRPPVLWWLSPGEG